VTSRRSGGSRRPTSSAGGAPVRQHQARARRRRRRRPGAGIPARRRRLVRRHADTAILYARASHPSPLARDPLYVTGDADATVAPPPEGGSLPAVLPTDRRDRGAHHVTASPEGEVKMTIWEHLGELRVRVVRAAIGLLVTTIIAWTFRVRIWLGSSTRTRWPGTTTSFRGLPSSST